MKKDLFRSIPKVDEILESVEIKEAIENNPRSIVVDGVRTSIDNLRAKIGKLTEEEAKNFTVTNKLVIDEVLNIVKKESRYSLTRVINGTGVVLHTNLGRSLISKDVIEQMVKVSCGYSTLEFDIENGKRGSRYSHVESLICKITGGEAAMVVNNNAAAVMLVLSAMTKDKEVIVSRGQLVEIGGSFRVPDVMKLSGADLVEIGTTNKTHLRDYENAITENTGAILKVHTSNYRILGFTNDIEISDLSELCRKHDLPLIEDIGSGSFVDFSQYGITKEPTVMESLEAGADVVTFSGDKMLGGPQAGIIVGKKKYIDLMKKNQLTRAIRVDKMTMAALEGTLKLYFDMEKANVSIPTLRMLQLQYEDIVPMAKALGEKISTLDQYELTYQDDYSEVGGGSMPLEKLSTMVLSVKHKNMSTNKVSELLRKRELPIICRISEDRVILDPRTIEVVDFENVFAALEEIK